MKFWQVDAFSKVPFQGNPAAVLILEKPLSDQTMQSIAAEMNLSETAFLLLDGEKPLLRWFTPKSEIDLCGHATLATGHIFFNEFKPKAQSVTFRTLQAGDLTVIRKAEQYTLDFPLRPGKELPVAEIPDFVLAALSPAKPIFAAQSRDLMLVYPEEAMVREMRPDFNALKDFDKFIIVTAPTTSATTDAKAFDFISRFYCAGDGIDEDPVTGSAHCTLAAYWAKRLGKNKMRAHQASERGGDLKLEVQGERVLISGDAITVFNGEFQIPLAI